MHTVGLIKRQCPTQLTVCSALLHHCISLLSGLYEKKYPEVFKCTFPVQSVVSLLGHTSYSPIGNSVLLKPLYNSCLMWYINVDELFNSFVLSPFLFPLFWLHGPPLSVGYVDLSNLFTFSETFPPLSSPFTITFSFFPFLALIIHFLPFTLPTIISLLTPPPTTPLPHFPSPLPSSIIRYPPARPGRIPGAWVSTPQRCLLGQAAAPGAAVWVIQPSQLTAACQRSRLHRLRHQVHRAGQPWGLLGGLPEWSSARGPEGSLHHWLPENGSRHRGYPPPDQCGPGWLRGGPKDSESSENADILLTIMVGT